MDQTLSTTRQQSLEETRWTRPLQLLTTIASVIFSIGTTLQNFVIVNTPMLEETMRLAGQTAAEAEENAPGFLLGFRIVGCIYIVGNALGILAFRGSSWVFWVALVVNITQAAGVVVIPPEVFEATENRYGWAGLLPTIVTDGGAVLVSLALLISFVVYRTTWARRRTDSPRHELGSVNRREESRGV